tara:strand:+ start:160 stop:381 length:222 start_codon:yes stop_codon:yes gene_type:complete
MNKLLQSTILHYEAKKAEAMAHLEIIFNNPVGIGEHTDYSAEVRKWTEILSQAQENLKTLELFITADGTQQEK